MPWQGKREKKTERVGRRLKKTGGGRIK